MLLCYCFYICFAIIAISVLLDTVNSVDVQFLGEVNKILVLLSNSSRFFMILNEN